VLYNMFPFDLPRADKEADTISPFIVPLAPRVVPYIRHIYTRIILDIGDDILKPDNGDEWQMGFEAIRVGLPNFEIHTTSGICRRPSIAVLEAGLNRDRFASHAHLSRCA